MSKVTAIVSDIKTQIICGQLSSGEKLPTEYDLVKKYSVSRQTVRKALASLQSENYIFSVQGSGYYIKYQAPAKKKTMRIAVITTYISEYIFPYILRDAEKIASNSGYTVQLYATNNSIRNEYQILKTIDNTSIDGILVEGTKTALPNPNVRYYKQLALSGIPIVFINGYYRELIDYKVPNIIYTVTDDYSGGFKAVDLLFNKGHVNIAGIFKSDDIQGTLRFSGYADAMFSSHASYNDENIAWFTTETKSTFLSGPDSLGFLNNCTAVVSYNDEITAALLKAMKQAEHTITDIVSFDNNIDFSQENDTTIISLGYPKYSAGNVAMTKLINMIDGKSEDSVLLSWTY